MLHEILSSMLCCFGTHGQIGSKQPKWLRKQPPSRDSPLSMSVPGASVPHALDSPDALRQIFASNSSTRGYNAVQSAAQDHAGHGSLDLNFRFGADLSPRKPHGRLEQLTNHVKQKLSETRLSRGSGQMETTMAAAPIQLIMTHRKPERDNTLQELGQSHNSLGMTELLASRAASAGGYDSDARSIQTPIALSTTGTVRLGSKFIRKSLAALETDCTEEQSTSIKDTTSLRSIPQTPSQHMSKSSPAATVPRAMSLSHALCLRPHESPTNALRRISDAIARGAVEMPNTMELTTARTSGPSLAECEWRLSLSAPQRSSSLRNHQCMAKCNPGPFICDTTLKELAKRVKTAREERATSTTSQSLLAELDPRLLDYVDKLSSSRDLTDHFEASPPVTAIKVIDKQDGKNIRPSKEITEPLVELHNIPVLATDSTESSRDQSLHLFNMRISQRLASHSHIPVSSSADECHGLMDEPSTAAPTKHVEEVARLPTYERVPTFISIEHNRKPSDPNTRRLFEHPTSNCLPTRSNRSLSEGSITAPVPLARQGRPTVDDSSSYYGSVLDGATGEHEMSPLPVRKYTIKNRNSLAIGGRCASGPPIHRDDMGQINSHWKTRIKSLETQDNIDTVGQTKNLEKVRLNHIQGRSFSAPKPSRFIKIDTTPTPVSRRLRPSTEVNENMSAIDVDSICIDDRNLIASESTQARDDRRNENFSDLDVSPQILEQSEWKNVSKPTRDWLSQSQKPGWSLDIADNRLERPNRILNISRQKNVANPTHLDNNAADVWHKAFKRLGEASDRGKLLATPLFDREGRRRRSIRNESQQGDFIAQLSSVTERRSQSVDCGHRTVGSELCGTKRRISVPILNNSHSRAAYKTSKTHQNGKKLLKSSLTDMKDKFNSVGILPESKKSRATSDGFGIWSRFASHTRDQRNGPAGASDGVKVRDFYDETRNNSNQLFSTPTKNALPVPELHRHRSWSFLTLAKPMLNRRNTRSLNFPISPAERARRRRKGVFGSLRKLYRTKSSELHSFAIAQGHRGSLSTGLSTEYPELECLPGEGAFATTCSHHPLAKSGTDGTEERDYHVLLDTISEVTSKRSKSVHSHTVPRTKRDAEELSKMYQDCIGSFSALRSEEGMRYDGHESSPTDKRKVLSMSSALRDSTLNFQEEMKKDADRAREHLLRQLQSSDDTGKGLPMPGSFV